MPYTSKEKKLHASLVQQYGAEKAEQVYHAMLNSGKHDAIFGARSKRERDGETGKPANPRPRKPKKTPKMTRKTKRRKKVKAQTKKRIHPVR